MGLGPPNLSSTVARFSFPGVRRRFDSQTVNGDGYAEANFTDTPTQGHLFPASGELLQRFSLQDVAGLFEVHSRIELRTRDREAGTPPDQWVYQVRAGGPVRTFEVVAAGPWLEGPSGANTWTVAALQEVFAS